MLQQSLWPHCYGCCSCGGFLARMKAAAVFLLVLWMYPCSGQDEDTQTIRILGSGGGFTRGCSYSGTVASWRWRRNGMIVDGQTGNTITLLPVKLVDQGNYSCEALNSSSNVLQTYQKGSLLVFDPSQAFTAPPNQYVVKGGDLELSCSSSVPDTTIRWRRNNIFLNSMTITMASEADEGLYECIIQDSGLDNIHTLEVQVNIVFPPNITSTSPQQLNVSNEQVILTVHFVSSYNNTTTISWQNNSDLVKRFSKGYTTSSKGTTSLTFNPARRSDNGRYSVFIYNSHPLIPEDRRRVSTEFTMKVIVMPTQPNTPSFHRINDTATRISWTIPNSTLPDAVANRFLLTLTNSLQAEMNLQATTQEVVVQTEPGVNYTATVTAINPDDSATSLPSSWYSPPTAPSVKSTSALRINATAFNVTLQVAFTGAGPDASLQLADVEFRSSTGEVGGAVWQSLARRVPLKSTSVGVWHAELVHRVFADLDKVEFRFNIMNSVVSNASSKLVQGMSVPPGKPEIIDGRTTSTSLTIQAQLSGTGTHPLTSLHTIVSAPDRPTRNLTKTDGLQVGGTVEVEVAGLAPGTSYTIIMSASNSAGKGPNSSQRIFTTISSKVEFPVWLIAVVAIIGSCLLITLILVILISCYCKRHSNDEKKINLSDMSSGNGVRQRPVGATDSVESLSTVPSFSYAYGSKNFVLSPPPQGNTTHSPTVSPARQEYNGKNSYIFTNPKPRPHASSFSGSEASEHSRYFTFRQQSPAHQSYITEVDKLSHSMPVLEDPDLTPTMPPNCSTFV